MHPAGTVTTLSLLAHRCETGSEDVESLHEGPRLVTVSAGAPLRGTQLELPLVVPQNLSGW